MRLTKGAYTTEDFVEGLKNSLEKDKWYDITLRAIVLENRDVVVDTISVRETKEEISDEAWIEGHRKWMAAKEELEKVYG